MRLCENRVNPKSIKRILLIRLRMIGDVVIATAVLRTMRKNFPGARITFVTGGAAGEILLNNPDIDDLMIYGSRSFSEMLTCVGYDLTINLDGGPESEMICFLSRARYRVGLSGQKARIGNGELYNIRPKRASRSGDIIDLFLDPVRSLGIKDTSRKTRLFLTREEKRFAAKLLNKKGLAGGGMAGVHPGGHAGAGALWGVKKFASLADKLTDRYGFDILIFRGPGESSAAYGVYDNMRNRSSAYVAPVLTLRKYISLVDRCKLFIAHDRGPMHISASLGVKTIGIFTSDAASFWFPYRDAKECAYIKKDNIRDIAVEDVIKAVEGVYP